MRLIKKTVWFVARLINIKGAFVMQKRKLAGNLEGNNQQQRKNMTKKLIIPTLIRMVLKKF
jgi:hypothetical protein